MHMTSMTVKFIARLSCCRGSYRCSNNLTFNTLWANAADGKLTIIFSLFLVKRLWHSMLVSLGDTLMK